SWNKYFVEQKSHGTKVSWNKNPQKCDKSIGTNIFRNKCFVEQKVATLTEIDNNLPSRLVWTNINGVFMKKKEGDTGNFLPSLNDFTVFTINIRSFLANIDELLILLNTINHKFDIVVLTETWLNMDINFTINGYTLVNSLCTINKTDGLSVLVICNSFYMAISKGNLSYYLTEINRLPSIKSEEFLSSIGLYLSELSPNSNHILCGDINIDLLTINGFYSACNLPTRIAKSSKTCIDHLSIKNIHHQYVNPHVLKSNITDHFSLILRIKSTTECNTKIINVVIIIIIKNIFIGLITSIRKKEKLNIFNRLIKESKIFFYGKKMIKAGNNSKLIWDCIKEASNTKIIKKSVLNEIFDKDGNIGSSIFHNITKNKYKSCDWKDLNTNYYIDNSIFFKPIETVNNKLSNELPVYYSVPQETALGSFLFIIYLNGLLNQNIDSGEIFCFADDTAIFFSSDCQNNIKNIVNTGLDKIKTWLDNNSLQINYDKSKFLQFKIKNNNFLSEIKSFILHNLSCKHVDNTCDNLYPSIYKTNIVKYLGLYIDDCLKWNEIFYVFKNIKNILNNKLKTMVYHAFMQFIVTWLWATRYL
ncbi:Reverse transcriptase domain-containing protein, partial [Aphis craccivora]